MGSNGVSQIAIDQQVTGPSFTVSTACASGAHAIGLAFHMVRSGMVTAALAGAHEAPLTRVFLRGWDSMRVVSPTACRPFSADRDGMTLAEGAAVLSLETLASAKARNAPIFAEILGFGMSADAHHITQPRPEGPTQAIRACLEDAARTLHATDQPGTLQSPHRGDRLHQRTRHGNPDQRCRRSRRHPCRLRPADVAHPHLQHQRLSRPLARRILGHRDGHHRARRLPFNYGASACDPALAIDLITQEPRAIASGAPILALTNALAFGGLNAILCLRSFSH